MSAPRAVARPVVTGSSRPGSTRRSGCPTAASGCASASPAACARTARSSTSTPTSSSCSTLARAAASSLSRAISSSRSRPGRPPTDGRLTPAFPGSDAGSARDALRAPRGSRSRPERERQAPLRRVRPGPGRALDHRIELDQAAERLRSARRSSSAESDPPGSWPGTRVDPHRLARPAGTRRPRSGRRARAARRRGDAGRRAGRARASRRGGGRAPERRVADRRSPTASVRAQTEPGVVSATSARTSSGVTGPVEGVSQGQLVELTRGDPRQVAALDVAVGVRAAQAFRELAGGAGREAEPALAGLALDPRPSAVGRRRHRADHAPPAAVTASASLRGPGPLAFDFAASTNDDGVAGSEQRRSSR